MTSVFPIYMDRVTPNTDPLASIPCPRVRAVAEQTKHELASSAPINLDEPAANPFPAFRSRDPEADRIHDAPTFRPCDADLIP